MEEQENTAARGTMRELVNKHDWANTGFGDMSTWPISLKTTVEMMLHSRFPMVLFWGKDLEVLYNDSYIPIFGGKHPWVLGKKAIEAWGEVWSVIYPMFQQVLRKEATWSKDQLLLLHRNGYTEETYLTWSYTPVIIEDGSVGGVITPITETTGRILGERRLRALREFGSRAANLEEVKTALDISADILTTHHADIPFAMIYMVDPVTKNLVLKNSSNLYPNHPAAPPIINPEQNGVWPVSKILKAETNLVVVNDLEHKVGCVLPGGLWEISSQSAALLPIQLSSPTGSIVAGVLILGINIRREFDDPYRGYMELVSGQVSASVSSARSYEEKKQRAEQLAELDRAKTTFFSNVSHEFRTPLTLILGPAEDALETFSTQQQTLEKYNTTLQQLKQHTTNITTTKTSTSTTITTTTPNETTTTELLEIIDSFENIEEQQKTVLSQQQEHVKLVHRNAMRLLKLVNSLLDFSRIEAGRMKAKFQVTDISKLVADLSSVFRAAFDKVGVKLHVDTDDVIDGDVYLDREMWEKIVYNLLSNAFKYTIQGEVHVNVNQNQNNVIVTVQDTGVGINAEELPRVFERFHRVENSQGRSHEGTGIGMALTSELVKIHGGTITVDSDFGEGTTFTISLPKGKDHLPQDCVHHNKAEVIAQLTKSTGNAFVQEALRWIPDQAEPEPTILPDPFPTNRKQSISAIGSFSSLVSTSSDEEGGLSSDLSSPVSSVSSEPGHPHLRPSTRRPCVLLADDNADIRDYVGRLLKKTYDVHIVADGQFAWEACNAGKKFDLILSDVMMPRMDGFQLMREVRTHDHTKGIPFILLSARAGEEARVEGLHAGADDYLVKPFSARELLARVTTHIELGRFRKHLAHLVKERTIELNNTNQALQQQIVEREAAEAALIDSEQRYRTMAKICPVGVIHADNEGKTTYVNERWCDIIGMSAESLVGTDVWRYNQIHAEDKIRVQTEWENALKYLVPFKSEFRYLRNSTSLPEPNIMSPTVSTEITVGENGESNTTTCEIIWVIAQDMPDIERSTGILRGFVCTLTDVTELKRLERDKYKAKKKAEAEQRRRALEAEEHKLQQALFIDMICHEIRNPLNGIINNVDLLQIARNSTTLIVEQILRHNYQNNNNKTTTTANITSSKLEENFTINMLCESLLKTFKEDSESLDAIMQCANHQKVITDDVITASKLESHKVHLSKFSNSKSIVVSDTGTGMTEREQAVLFQRFSQANDKTYHQYGGSGLGLYISNEIVRLMDGTIRVESTKGVGSRFSCCVVCDINIKQPKLQQQQQPQPQQPLIQTTELTTQATQQQTTQPTTQQPTAQTAKNTSYKNIKLLIVEDNIVNQKVLLRQLTLFGFTCELAVNGQEAVDKFKSQKFHLIFMDLEMPVLDGLEATKQIRQYESLQKQEGVEVEDVTIIGLSGNARYAFEVAAKQAGMNDYVVKPYQKDLLLEKIIHYLHL